MTKKRTRIVRIKESDLIKIIQNEVNRQLIFHKAEIGIPQQGYSIVRHMRDSTDDSEIWKEYWEENHPSHHFPSEPHECPSCLSLKKDFVGGHVVSENDTHIIPVCRECNSTYKGDKADNHFFYVKSEDMVRVPQN